MTTDPALEAQLTNILDASAASLPDSRPPAFSWQVPSTSSITASRRRRPSLRTVFAITTPVAAAAAALVVVALPSGGNNPTQQAAPGSGPIQSAPVLLLAAADTTVRVGEPTLKPGQYRYVRTVSAAPSISRPSGAAAGGVQQPAPATPAPAGSYSLSEVWIPQDENAQWLRRDTVVGETIPGYPRTFQGLCGDFYAKTQDGSIGRTPGDSCTRPADLGNPSPAFIAGLPRDADTLFAQLHTYAAANLNPTKNHDVNSVMLMTAQQLLDTGMIPSDLTATLYTVMSRIPGITVVPNVKNAAGQTGTGFRLTATFGQAPDTNTETETVIVDLATGAYLGHHQVAAGLDDLDAVSVGVADSLGVAGH